jgi:hypothetical protein
MPEKIDNRGTRMSVRPMVAHEMKRWPDAEIAFTIHYGEGEGAIKAHALTKIEDAEEFAHTIRLACVDARGAKEAAADPEFPKEKMRGRVMFMRCPCGKLYRLNPGLFSLDEEDTGDYVCPNCLKSVLDEGTEVSHDDGWGKESEKLLPEGVIQHEIGIRTYYTGLDGKRLNLR